MRGRISRMPSLLAYATAKSMVAKAWSLYLPRDGISARVFALSWPVEVPRWERTTVIPARCAASRVSLMRKYVGWSTPPTFSSKPSQ